MTASPAGRVSSVLDGHLLIGDQRLDSASGGVFTHVNPATGQAQASVPLAGAAEMDHAVATARAALPGWRELGGPFRRNVLFEIGRRLGSDTAPWIEIAALETGIPVAFAGMAAAAAEWFSYYAGWADKIDGQQIPVPSPGFDFTIMEPYGVIAAIIPWNAPLMGLAMKVAPALAAGNCVVLKPPELGPFAALRFADLARECGLPPGVLNVVPAGPVGGDALVRHPGIDKISFTGSGATATQIAQAAGANLTPLALELGGKSPNIVFADADLERVLTLSGSVPFAALCGQGCVLPTKVLVQRCVYADAVELLAASAQALRVGDPFSPTTQVGPVISERACDRIMGVIRQAGDERAGRLVSGGARLDGDLASGFFIEPTIFADVDPTSRLARDEVFGPVVAVLPFDDEAHAIALANDSRFGLGAYLHTADVSRAHRLCQRLEAGTVIVNGFGASRPYAPFGGVKASGYGKEGGPAGLAEFVRAKNVHLTVGE